MKQTISAKKGILISFLICFVFAFVQLLFINGVKIGSYDYIHSMMFCRDGFDNSIFVNYFYAVFVTFVQHIMPQINAFIILEILFSFLAFWSICNMLFKKYATKTAVILSV